MTTTFKNALLSLIFAVSFCGSTHADLIFNLTQDIGSAGEALEIPPGTFTSCGIRVEVSATSTIPGNTGAVFSANSSSAGINTGNVTGAADAASALDAGETLTFTFTFTNPDVRLTEVDFSGVGGNDGAGNSAGDAAFVTAAGTSVSLFTGVSGFSGGSDTWTPAGGIALVSGDTLVVSAEDNIILSSFTLTAAAVPEPSSLVLFGIAGLFGTRRRRSR